MEPILKNKHVLLCTVFLAAIGFAFKNPALKKIENKRMMLKKSRAIVIKRADFDFKNIEFDFNKSTVRKNCYKELDQIAAKLIETRASLKLSGHADNRGTYLVNWKVSQARAEFVKKYLTNKGCDQTKIAATEFGDTKPIASNETRLGRQKNRRVEIEAY